MSESTAGDVQVVFELGFKDMLQGYWIVYLQARKRLRLRPASQHDRIRTGKYAGSLSSFVLGVCLGTFHFVAAVAVALGACNAFGVFPQFGPDHAKGLASILIGIGIIWFWLLAGPAIEKRCVQAAYLNRLKRDLPELLQGDETASIQLTARGVISDILQSHTTTPLGPVVSLIEAEDCFLLRTRGEVLPISWHKLSRETVKSVRDWGATHGVLSLLAKPRDLVLSARASVWLGVALGLFCLWVGTHLRIVPDSVQSTIYPKSVTLALPDASLFIEDEIVTLNRQSYSMSDYNGVLYDQLSGTIGRPEMSGAFHVDRSARPYLAQTAAAEFYQERGWTLAIGKIPDSASIEELPGSGVFIAWDNPMSADYPGRCGALRVNGGTIAVPGGRVLWRRRIYLDMCSATLPSSALREWMLQAAGALDSRLAAVTQTNL